MLKAQSGAEGKIAQGEVILGKARTVILADARVG